MNISAEEYMHPEDKTAIENLRSLPVFPALEKAFQKNLQEPYFHGKNMARKIRLGPNQLPDIYNLLPPICATLNIGIPEFYLEMQPKPNAYTFGETKPYITIQSGLLEYFDTEEIKAVLAHECGHIACHHLLYKNMVNVLLNQGGKVFGPLAAIAGPAKLPLLYWVRRSELSADRAAAIAMGGIDPVIKMMIRFAGGPKSITDQINVGLFLKQAEAFEGMIESSWWDKALQGYAILYKDHPFWSVRVREIIRWSQDLRFKSILHAIESEQSPVVECSACHKSIKVDWGYCHYCGNCLTINVG